MLKFTLFIFFIDQDMGLMDIVNEMNVTFKFKTNIDSDIHIQIRYEYNHI